MWNLTNKTKKQNRNRFIDKENRLRTVSPEEVWGLNEKAKGLSKELKSSDTDNSMMITRGKARSGKVEEGKWEIGGDGRRLDLGW